MGSSNKRLQGVITPVVTPLHENQTLDGRSLAHLLEHVLAGGVHGLFVLGSTGEGPSLSVELRSSVIQAVSEVAGRRVPLIVNVSDTSFAHALQLAEEAARRGAFAVALSPPSYFVIDQEQLAAYVAKFSRLSPLPIFVYNIPQFAHTAFAPKTVCELAELPNVIGLKNSNGNLDYLREVRDGLAQRDTFTLLVGNEETFLPALQSGADGGVCGGANLFPEVFVRLFEAATEGRWSDAETLQSGIVETAKAIYEVGARETSYLRGLKRALAKLGKIEDVLAEPLQNFSVAEQNELDMRLAQVLATESRAIHSLIP